MYAKIFAQIFESSIAENYELRHIFEDLIKLADRHGVVDMTFESIARRTNMPIEKLRWGIAELLKPDPESRSRAEKGRRLIPLDPSRAWGWKLVNYAAYRDMKDSEARNQYMRELMRKKRSKSKPSKPVSTPLADVSTVSPSSSSSSSSSSSDLILSASADTQQPSKLKTEVKHPTLEECKAFAPQAKLTEQDAEEFFWNHERCGWVVNRKPIKSWRAAMHYWRTQKPKFTSQLPPGNKNPSQVKPMRLATIWELTQQKDQLEKVIASMKTEIKDYEWLDKEKAKTLSAELVEHQAKLKAVSVQIAKGTA